MKLSDVFTLIDGVQYVSMSAYEAVVAERDDADRRAGAAERRLGGAEDTSQRRVGWLREAKQARGYRDHVSFDTVWAETCMLADITLKHREISRVEMAKTICAALGDDWNREGPGGLIAAYGPAADAVLRKLR